MRKRKIVKKICFFEGDISRSGGTERVTIDIANELSLLVNKYEVHILSICRNNDNSFFTINDNVILDTIFDKPEFNAKKDFIKVVSCLRKYIIMNEIDILIDVDTILDVYSVFATRFTNTKLIAWEHFNYYENLGVKFRDLGRKLSAKFADKILTITKEDKKHFEENLKLNCQVDYIYNPVTLKDNTLSYKHESKVILSAGRLTEQKGFDLLLDVAREVFKNHPDWKWVILGEGEDRDLLEKKIIEYNLYENVILEGNVKNMAKYYENASMFVLTSRYEGFGLVLTEAKSYGLPCISFRCKCGPSEIIKEDINGYLIECFDTSQMAKKITYLITNKEKRIEFSKKSLDNMDEFLKDAVIKKWIDLLDNL